MSWKASRSPVTIIDRDALRSRARSAIEAITSSAS